MAKPGNDSSACGGLARPFGHSRAAQSVLLLGLDFGSTTSSALIARSSIITNSLTGNTELGDIRIVFRSEIAFTPFSGGDINEAGIQRLLDGWLDGNGYRPDDFFAGGVIITGLAARKQNAAAISRLIEARIGEILVATADDPNLESWLAFKGSCAALSRHHSRLPIINLDIGGGTTNPASGMNGAVLTTGCYLIGARHIQFFPGSYRIKALTEEAQALFRLLGIRCQTGDMLEDNERRIFLGCYVEALENIVRGNAAWFDGKFKFLQQVPFRFDPAGETGIVFSGGVGELIYKAAAGETLPPTTYYGDFGIDLARAILASPALSRSVRHLVPENHGRATVYGLALHATEVSGSTLYLPHPEILPLRHLPIVAKLSGDIPSAELRAALEQAYRHPGGACVQMLIATSDGFRANRLKLIRTLGGQLADALRVIAAARTQPLVILVDCNIGKSLGAYASEWGKLDVNLVIIDEIAVREANFVNISRMNRQVVPVSFYGLK